MFASPNMVSMIVLVSVFHMTSLQGCLKRSSNSSGSSDAVTSTEPEDNVVLSFIESVGFIGLLAVGIEQGRYTENDVKMASLTEFKGSSDRCEYSTKLQTTVCLATPVLYLDSKLLSEGKEGWGGFRIRAPKIPRVKDLIKRAQNSVKKDLKNLHSEIKNQARKDPRKLLSKANPKSLAATKDKARAEAKKYEKEHKRDGKFSDCVTVVSAGIIAYAASSGGEFAVFTGALGAAGAVAVSRFVCSEIYEE